MPKVSVLSMTYNRANLLRRLYQSLCESSFQDFEWIVVNDGSADDTDQVMEELIKDSTFPVVYFKHEVNKGLPAVYNKLFDLASGEYSIIIADDDELLPEALEKAVRIWESIPADKRSCFASVGGRCIDAGSGIIVGDLYPDNVNKVSCRKRKRIFMHTKGEKIGLERTEILKRNAFPEVKGVFWIPESCFWRKAYEKYDLFLTNEPFRVYHQNEGESICTTGRTRKAYKNKYYCNKYLLGGGKLGWNTFDMHRAFEISCRITVSS